jgi:predicted nuclease of predicted toxin-antitoxin system
VSLKLLIDMNLSPDWVTVLEKHGWQATHWSSVGDPRAPDREIMTWAQTNLYTVFTHDLDFGMLLAVTRAEGPSVIQVRAQDVTPTHLENLVVSVLKEYGSLLEIGALIVADESKSRARILPLRE